jgi:DNA-3-methyladenine glycosylase
VKGCSSLARKERFLSRDFFDRDTIAVARDLLGREIVRELKTRTGTKFLRARIVETEAYLQDGDPAAHCSRGPTPRARVMFQDPGLLYVYFIYGNYFMLNFVTEKPGKAGAVLIRAVEPLEGIETMEKLRFKGRSKKTIRRELTNGPAKLVMAMGINGSLNGRPVGFPHLAVAEGMKTKTDQVAVATRVGISAGKELPYRFYVKGNSFVSCL